MKIDSKRVQELTRRKLESIKRLKDGLESLSKDSSKDARLAQGLCLHCFYLKGATLAGQAFTEYQCQVCDNQNMHPNTATPDVCDNCSKKHNICCDCGADLNLDPKAKKNI